KACGRTVTAQTPPTVDIELETWRAEDGAARVDYARAVIDELGISATEGFNRLPHGGVEIGGVLFGTRESDRVKALAYRALECEHALGPSFTLSENDRRAFEELLNAPAADSELAGMQPVGWYVSHNRSDLPLREKDVQLFDRYFPDRWQVTLVLRPNRFEPVKACFFFRERDGSLHAMSASDAFIIAPQAALLRPAEQEPAPAVEETPLPLPRRAPVTAELPARAPVPRARRRRFWMAAAAAALAGIAGGVAFWAASQGASTDLSLRALDVGGQLQIEWACTPRILERSEGGSLEIEDGSHKVLNELTPQQLRAGSLTYTRSTGNVLARL